jgi:beta-galactosidase
MYRWLVLLLIGSAPVGMEAQTSGNVVHQGTRTVQELSADWKFLKGDAAGSEAATFDDATWQRVSVPHDWAIAQPFDETSKSRGAGAFLPGGVSWYRRELTLTAAEHNRQVSIEFDGVMANSQVWLNGHLLGARPNGYVSLGYDLTPWVQWGGKNVLAVRTDTSQQPASRWYEGAGIYRRVRLVVQSPVHVARWGTFVTTPEVSAASATVHVQTTVENHGAVEAVVQVRARLLDPQGKTVATGNSIEARIASGASQTFQVDAKVAGPDRWDVGHGAMYRAVVDVLRDGKASDEDSVSFGIREFHFDAATGFWLNGRNFKIYGAALHVDAGAFGIAVPAEAYRERFEALRSLGVNAIRTAHNPPSPEFLAMTDSMGLLVMDEMFDAWSVGKETYDYHVDFAKWHVQDTHDAVRRDRNHPSVILWSAGNEIHDTPKADLAKQELASILEVFHEEDPTRPSTQALFRPNVSHDYEDGLADMLDVVGQNYRTNELVAAHEQKPTRKVVGTENTHDLQQWLDLRDHAFFSGEFLWAGADYLGESRTWPGISRSNGLLDRTDGIHVRGLQRASWWVNKPFIAAVRRVKPAPLAPTDPGYEKQQMGADETAYHDWTPESQTPHNETVEVYSNCKSVDLKLNGSLLGVQTIHADDSPRSWSVAFAPGELRAACEETSGTVDALKTAGKPDHLVVTSLSPRVGSGFDDVVQVRAVVMDAAGTRVPRAEEELRFEVSGPGRVVAVDNADLASHEPFQASSRAAYDGTAVAYVRGSGRAGAIRVRVSAEGLKPGEITVKATGR